MTMTTLQPDGAVHIWLVNLEQVPEARLEDYRALLSEDERDRLQNYKNPKVRLSQLITRAAVRVCLSQYAEDVTPEAWQFERNEAGKPQLVQAPRPLSLDRKSTRLNSSHVAISYAVFCLKKKKT